MTPLYAPVNPDKAPLLRYFNVLDLTIMNLEFHRNIPSSSMLNNLATRIVVSSTRALALREREVYEAEVYEASLCGTLTKSCQVRKYTLVIEMSKARYSRGP